MTAMIPTTTDPRALVRQLLHRIAPDAAAAVDTLADEALWQEELELDSMDFLNLVSALDDAAGIEIPERDYPELVTWAGFLAYVEQALSSGRHGPDAGR